MSPSPLLSKLKYFSQPELISFMKAFSAISPGNSSAVVAAVEDIEQEVRVRRASYLIMEPHTETTIQNLEKSMGHKFRYPEKAAALLPRLSSPIQSGNVTFFRPCSPPPLPDCFAAMDRYPRRELIRMFEEFSLISDEHQSDIVTLIRESEEQMEARRARIVMDPDIESRIEKVENAIGHRFRDPRRAAEALTHPSYLQRSSRKMSRFPLLQFVGEGFIKSVAGLHLHGMIEGKKFNFPIEVTDTISKVATSSEFLARVAVRLGLWENSLHRLPAAVREKVKLFEASVEKGAFNVRPPKVLSELTGTIGASIYTDCLSIDVFYLKWVDNLFLQDNPVFVLYDRCINDNPILYRRDNLGYFPCLTRKSGVWVVEHNDKILGSGKTIMEAADAANRKEH